MAGAEMRAAASRNTSLFNMIDLPIKSGMWHSSGKRPTLFFYEGSMSVNLIAVNITPYKKGIEI
jgi:hypothetical protein